MNDWAKESGHWYDAKTGEPRYTTIGKNGRERPTTLRDAKREPIVPGATTVMSVMAKPALEAWKADQLLLSALTATRLENESDDSFKARIKRDAAQQGKDAAEFGTRVHGAIECHYRNEWYDPKLALFVAGAVEQVEKYWPGGGWSAERSFASPLGYGGKVDLFRETEEQIDGSWGRKYVVIDFKGKDGDLEDLNRVFDENVMQASSYAVGLFGGSLEGVQTANIFFSRTHPGIAKTIIHTDEERERGWEMFKACLALWCAQKGYEP